MLIPMTHYLAPEGPGFSMTSATFDNLVGWMSSSFATLDEGFEAIGSASGDFAAPGGGTVEAAYTEDGIETLLAVEGGDGSLTTINIDGSPSALSFVEAFGGFDLYILSFIFATSTTYVLDFT